MQHHVALTRNTTSGFFQSSESSPAALIIMMNAISVVNFSPMIYPHNLRMANHSSSVMPAAFAYKARHSMVIVSGLSM